MMQQMQHLPLKMTNSDLEDEEFRADNMRTLIIYRDIIYRDNYYRDYYYLLS